MHLFAPIVFGLTPPDNRKAVRRILEGRGYKVLHTTFVFHRRQFVFLILQILLILSKGWEEQVEWGAHPPTGAVSDALVADILAGEGSTRASNPTREGACAPRVGVGPPPAARRVRRRR